MENNIIKVVRRKIQIKRHSDTVIAFSGSQSSVLLVELVNIKYIIIKITIDKLNS